MIVDWAGKYVGLDYRLGSVGPKYFDCWGLVVWVYKQEFKLTINEGIFYMTKEDRAILLREHIGKWLKIIKPQPGDGILFMIGGKIPHCGIYVGESKMLHSVDRRMSCIENINSPKWKSRLEGYYRYSPGTS